MSSLRNAVKRVTHKERSQPRNRTHLGILEKKSDYKGRAQDYQRKKQRIHHLQEKASQRNPDEFYFGMKNSQVIDGKHRKTKEAQDEEFASKVGQDTIRLMKSQDLGYVRMQRQKESKKVERMGNALHLTVEGSSAKQRNHTIFVETAKDAKEFDAAEYFDTLPEFVGRSFNRPRRGDLEKEALRNAGAIDDGVNSYQPTEAELGKMSKQQSKLAKKMAKARAVMYREVEERKERMEKLKTAEAHLVMEKSLQGKGRKRKIAAGENGQPAQYKWRRKRLR